MLEGTISDIVFFFFFEYTDPRCKQSGQVQRCNKMQKRGRSPFSHKPGLSLVIDIPAHLSHVLGQADHLLGVAIFVVVPRIEHDALAIGAHDCGLAIEH